MKSRLILFFLLSISLCYADANLIQSISVTKNKIVIEPTQELKDRFGTPKFFVEYDDDEIDLTKLPYSITTLPFIAHMVPMIWLSGDTFYVDVMDQDFSRSLERIQQVIRVFYPSLGWRGRLIPRKKESYSFMQSPEFLKNRKGVLSPFSGGVDSLYNVVGTFGKKQQLVSVWGGDVPLPLVGMWEKVKAKCKDFSKTWDADYATVKSNFTNLYGFDENVNPVGLWTMAGQSLSYSSLVAPMAVAKGYPFILIGSAVTKELALPYGSHPFIDHAINFAGINVIHFGGECDRSEKIRFIIDACKRYNKPNIKMRVCWKKEPGGENCCECVNKCLGTIHALLAEGEDPAEWGFQNWSPERVIKLTREMFETESKIQPDRASIWNAIKSRIQERLKDGKSFKGPMHDHMMWVVQKDFDEIVDPAKLMPEPLKEKLGQMFTKSMNKAYDQFESYNAQIDNELRKRIKK